MNKTFYSWQSDLPSHITNSLIKAALRQAIGGLTSDGIAAEMDEATRGAIGAVHIAETLFEKIGSCSAFVADVSIVGRYGLDQTPTPNPNVMAELGYAARHLGWDGISLVFNSSCGSLDGKPLDPKAALPFDIGFRRMIMYELAEGATVAERKRAQDDIALSLSKGLKDTFVRLKTRPQIVDLSRVPNFIVQPLSQTKDSLTFLVELDRDAVTDVRLGAVAKTGVSHTVQTIKMMQAMKHYQFTISDFLYLPEKIFVEFQAPERNLFRLEYDFGYNFDSKIVSLDRETMFIQKSGQWVPIEVKG